MNIIYALLYCYLFRCNFNSFTCRRIPTGIALTSLHIERAQTTDLHPITLFECDGHLVEKYGYNPGCFNFGKTICDADDLDEIEFVHGIPFFDNCSWLDK